MNESKCETRKRVEQERFDRLRDFIGARQAAFSRQGAIVASWREYQGRKLGPYYRLAWREEGRQRSLYLGCSAWVVEKIRELLAGLQRELRGGRMLRRLEVSARAAMRWTKELLRQELARLGLRLKGFEVRGGRLADALKDELRPIEGVLAGAVGQWLAAGFSRQVASQWARSHEPTNRLCGKTGER